MADDRLRRRGDRARLPRPAVAVRRPARPCSTAARRRRRGRSAVVADVMAEHAAACSPTTTGDELNAMRDFRKHTGWYLTGYPVGPEVRRRLRRSARCSSSTPSSPSSTRRPTGRRAASASSAATPTVRSRSRCPTASSTTVDDARPHPRRRRRDGPVGRLTARWPSLGSCSRRRRLGGRSCSLGSGSRSPVVPADVDESVRPGEEPVDYVERLSPMTRRCGVASSAGATAMSWCSPPTRPSTSTARSSASRPTTPTPGACCGLLSGRDAPGPHRRRRWRGDRLETGR